MLRGSQRNGPLENLAPLAPHREAFSRCGARAVTALAGYWKTRERGSLWTQPFALIDMQGEDRKQQELFSYVLLEDRVPTGHPLRAIRRMVDEALNEQDQASMLSTMRMAASPFHWSTGTTAENPNAADGLQPARKHDQRRIICSSSVSISSLRLSGACANTLSGPQLHRRMPRAVPWMAREPAPRWRSR